MEHLASDIPRSSDRRQSRLWLRLRSALAIALLLPTLAAAHGSEVIGIIVHSVNSGGPAAAAGLLTDDRFIELDGHPVTTMEDLQKVMVAHQPGDTVPLTVARAGETVELKLTFGERPGGAVSIGVKLEIGVDPASDGTAGVGTRECLAWVEETYRLDVMIRDLGLDFSAEAEAMRSCIERDTRRMTTANAIKYCDNVFKVHCSGIDLLTEIGEALVQRCEGALSKSLGIQPQQTKGWRTCAQHKVADRYALQGEASDETACRTALLETCGTNIDAAVKTNELSSDQQAFVECCSADELSPDSPGDTGHCGMIDEGFERGPCLDRPVCINRLSTEWIHCSESGS